MKILLVEDEAILAKSMQNYLSDFDFICEHAAGVEDALLKIELYEYDCILLDLSLPDGHGFDVLKKLKELHKSEGVIIISAKENLETRLEGFQFGADDFLTKPFHLSELLVRIQALIRRLKFKGQNVLTFREITIDLLSKIVKVNDTALSLTKKENELLLFLIGNRGNVLSKSSIAEHLSGDMADLFDNHDFVYAHIKNLKKKLLEAGAEDYIKTVYGIGYRWQHD